jgi:hypothetical protein
MQLFQHPIYIKKPARRGLSVYSLTKILEDVEILFNDIDEGVQNRFNEIILRNPNLQFFTILTWGNLNNVTCLSHNRAVAFHIHINEIIMWSSLLIRPWEKMKSKHALHHAIYLSKIYCRASGYLFSTFGILLYIYSAQH